MAYAENQITLEVVSDGQGTPGENGATIWTATANATTPNYTFNISDLTGQTGRTPQVGDLVVRSYYRYTISSVGSTTVLTNNRTSIRGSSGEPGNDGTTFTPSVDSAGDISWTNDGGKTNPATQNIMGPQGDEGTTFTPSVDANGNISWTNDGGKTNPTTQNIKGPTGNGIASITLISTSGLNKTYRITYTDGNHYDYTVTDGADTSSQYMSFSSTDGLRVYSGDKDSSTYNTSYTQIKTDGITIAQNSDDVAFFGQSARIGKLSSKNLVIDSNGIQGYNNTTKEIGISLSNGFEIKKETNDCKSRLYTNVVSGSATYILEASGGTNKNVGCEANATSSGSNAISLYATKGTNEAFIQMRADTAGEIYVNNGKYYGLLDDFVIKQGTSGNWRYRKWSSGFIEAWYESTATASATTAVNISSRTVSYRSTWSTTIPSAIGFTSTPKIIVSLGSSSDIRMSINGAASSTTAISGYCWRSSSSTSTYDITPRIYAWGS